VAAIQRQDEQAHVPGAGDVIRAGDTLVVLAPASALKSIRKLFV
jgi:K+/H+ antiporter YhaU regulatory subunit KhtT